MTILLENRQNGNLCGEPGRNADPLATLPRIPVEICGVDALHTPPCPVLRAGIRVGITKGRVVTFIGAVRSDGQKETDARGRWPNLAFVELDVHKLQTGMKPHEDQKPCALHLILTS
jgi:hypothetical protein